MSSGQRWGHYKINNIRTNWRDPREREREREGGGGGGGGVGVYIFLALKLFGILVSFTNLCIFLSHCALNYQHVTCFS